nr:xylulose kinase-1 [Tanacetum cinerariifolium]
MVAYLSKSDAIEGYNQIIDFLNGSSIKYALTVNPNIYVSCIKQFWTTVSVKKVNDVIRLQALVDKKKVVVTKATIRDAHHLDDAEGVECLPNEEIFAELTRMGYEKPSTKLTFYKVKGFFGVKTPLFEGMLVAQEVGIGVANEMHDEGVPAVGVVTEGDVSVAHDEVPTVAKEPSIPSPTPPNPPPQPSHDIPSTSQGRMIAEMDQDVDVVVKEAKEVADDAKAHQDAKEEETEPAKVQEVVDVVTTAKLITEVVTAASITITATEVPVPTATTTAAFTLTTAPRRRTKGVVIRDPKESTTTTSIIIHTEAKSKDKGKGILAKEDPAVKRYQALKRKPQTEAHARRNMIIYLKNVVGFKMDYFKGMSYDDIRPIFEVKFNTNVAFLQKTKEQIEEEESKALKRLNETLAEKERFSTTKPKNFFDDFLLITLGAIFEKSNIHAQIWKNQRSVHGLAKVKGWKLLESCGVQIITFTTIQPILLVERKYPLTRFTLDQMLNASKDPIDSMEHQDDLTNVVPPIPHASPLLGGHTLGSDEGRPNLLELMNIYTQLANKVLGLEEAKTTQDKVITGLKLRVKRIEKKRKVRTSQLMKRRMFKGRVETSTDKILGEDASKQRRNDDKIEELNLTNGDDTEVLVEDKGSGEKVVVLMIKLVLLGQKSEKAKEKEVVFRDVKEPPRLTRSTTTLQPLPTIDPKDKELAQIIYEEELAELDRAQKERQKQEEATIAALTEKFDEIQARMMLIMNLLAEAIRNKPPIRTQVRNMMITYLKHMGKYTHQQLKRKTFEELQKLYQKEQKWIDDFVPIDSEKEEKKSVEPESKGKKGKIIKRVSDSALKQKPSKKQKMMQEQESVKSDKEESGDYEHEKEELRMWLTVVLDEEETIDPKILSTKVHTLLIDGTLNCFNLLEEKRYPLIKEMLEKMLNWKLEAEAKSTMEFSLLKFIKS